MKLYSYENDVILDPLNVSGQATKIPHNFSRRYIGIEMIQEYIDLAKSRMCSEPFLITAYETY
jgi:DNA modification methylase